MEARAYVQSHAREFIDDLKQWLAIPSISADPQRHGDVRRSAEWLAVHLGNIGFPVAEVWETAPDGLPAVFAEWPAADPDAPKVLIYGHHDVQPVEPRGLVNISGGGLLNLGRLAADVSYELDALPPPPPVFALIAEKGGVSAASMYATFNMGTGFAIVVPAARQQAAMAALKSVGEEPARVGWVTGRPGRAVSVPAAGIRGRGDTFDTV